MRRIFFFALLLTAAAAIAVPANAQFAPAASSFKDTRMIKPPFGAKVAIWEFEDLECPACARAFPLVHEAAHKYGIPLLRHDYPLPMHIWSFDAAVNARYIQDVVKNPALADEYRRTAFPIRMTCSTSPSTLPRRTRSIGRLRWIRGRRWLRR